MAGLRGALPVVDPAVFAGVRPSARLPDETPDMEASYAMQRETQPQFAAGITSGARGLKASSKAYLGQLARTAGYDDVGDALIAEAAADTAYAGQTGPRVQRLEDIHGSGDVADYAAGMAGTGVASMVPTMATAAATRGAGLRAGLRYPLNAAPMTVPMAGESLQAINADPVASQLSDAQKLGLSTVGGVGGSVLEAAVPTYLVDRVFSPAKVAGSRLRAAATDLARAHIGEGTSEVASNELNRQMVGAINPERDTTGDAMSRANEFVGAAIGGAPVITPSVAASHVLGTSRDGAGAAFDAGKTLAGKLPTEMPNVQAPSMADVGQKAGQAVTKVRSWLEDRVTPVDPDAKTLMTDQTSDPRASDFNWLKANDAERHAAADRLARKISVDEMAPQSLKAAAADYLNGTKAGDSWAPFAATMRTHEKNRVVGNAIDRMTKGLDDLGVKIGKVGSDLKGGYEKGRRMNMQEVGGSNFNDLFVDGLFKHAASDDTGDSTEAKIKLAQAAPAIMAWARGGFKDKDGAVSVPDGFDEVFAEPDKAVKSIYDMLRRQGLDDKIKPADVLDVIVQAQGMGDARKPLGAIVEDGLLLTAQEQHQFSGADHERIGSEIARMVKTGDINEPLLDSLFGPKKDRVLEAIARATGRVDLRTQREGNVYLDDDNTDDDRSDAKFEELQSITSNALDPNVVRNQVGYHGIFDREGGSEAAAAEASKMESKLYGEGNKVSKVGVHKALEEQYAAKDPMRFVDEMLKLLDTPRGRKATEVAKQTGKRVEDVLDSMFYTLKAETETDKPDALTVPGEDFQRLSSKNHKWARSPGKDGEYSTADRGAIWLEAYDYSKPKATPNEDGEVQYETKPFMTTAHALINFAQKAKAEGVFSSSEGKGAVETRNMFMAGLASVLAAATKDEQPALTGRIGLKTKADGPTHWLNDLSAKNAKKVLSTLKLYGQSLADIEALSEEQRAQATRTALSDWIERRENAGNTGERLDKAKELLAGGDTAKMDGFLTLNSDEWGAFAKDSKTAAYVKETKIIGHAVDKETGADVHVTRTETKHLSEGEEVSEQANAAADDKIRTHDELTGEEIQPRPTRHDTKAAREARAEAQRVMDEALAGREVQPKPKTEGSKLGPTQQQLDYVRNLLAKGVPAFSAVIEKATKDQLRGMAEALRTVYGDLGESLQRRADVVLAKIAGKLDGPDGPKGGRRALSKQSLLDGLGTESTTPEEQAKVRAEITRRLGPNIKVEFGKIFAENGDVDVEVSGDWTENMIRVSIDAMNPSQIGAHESMHEFFNRLLQSESKDVQKVLETLVMAASSKPVLRQLEQLLIDHPNAREQIKDGAENALEERLAYMFQFWQAGLLHVGPETKTAFQKIADFLRRVVGLLSNDQKAEQLLAAFDRGDMPTADAAAMVLANNIEFRERQLARARAFMDPLAQKMSALITPTEEVLVESGNPHLVEIAHEFKNPTAKGGVKQSFFEAEAQQKAYYMNMFNAIISGADKKDLELALRYLRQADTSKVRPQINDEKISKIYDGIRSLFDDMAKYMHDADVRRLEMDDTGKPVWVSFRDVKMYFPRAYDAAAIAADPQGFVNKLLERHGKELQKMAQNANAGIEDEKLKILGAIGGKEHAAEAITAEKIAQGIANRLITSYGQADLDETQGSVGFSPVMLAVNERSLTWLDTDFLRDYMNDDMVNIVGTYIAQGTKRAEYTRRFGQGGEKLREKVLQAFDFEANKLAEERGIDTTDKEAMDALTPDVLQTLTAPGKQIMAMEGTLGYEIDPKLRRLSGTVVVYENFRLLATSLFAQFIDPLGIVIRGGSMQDAWKAYTRGLKEVWKSWNDEHSTDRDAQIAEFVGTVDAAGFLANYGQLYNSMYLNGKVRKWNDALFKWNGMDGFSRGIRIQATQAAISFLKHHKNLPNEFSQEYLDELNLKPEDIEIDANGDLNYGDQKIREAIHRWVNGAILRPNAGQRPAWMSDPHYMVFSHMKSFSFAFHDTILKRVFHEAKNHGNVNPFAFMLASFVPTMIAADAAKSILLTGDEPTWMKQGLDSTIMHGVNRAGLFGRYQPLMDAASGMGAVSVAGPAVEQAVESLTQPFSETVTEALPGQNVIKTVSKD